ncbi:NACHT domain-containing protein [Actinophytocola xanthii]|uniref:Large ATP-binding protein n=1 Tax=Actinophytocola xanthii TaxID=1912961 RepID=A0A1Q8CSS4_9PSEU|nr:large ATP-binding protein [Actinophytocola xanthii]OLF17415.1 large ATP-binding protein [Actinophytocola xanthii]
MPESRHKYLYERLGDHDFQLLVNALLTARFTDFVPLPLRQADGGRDGLRRSSGKTLVYQVKWSANGRHRDPVGWLDATVRGEEDNLRRLATEGVKRYVLVTNVPSTGRARTGTFDQLNKKLDTHSKAFGFDEMTCLWREAVDGMVDGAGVEIKWQYADMLAGWDLVRYLISEEAAGRRDRGLRALVRKVAATQWDDDERVKFSQVDIDREKVVDLFIDVSADRFPTTSSMRGDSTLPISPPVPAGGAAAHLLHNAGTCTLVRGTPGQGKSTLSQYVSQVHRSAFIPSRQRPPELPVVDLPLFPLRFDLSDYARWLSGVDVWDKDAETSRRARKRSANQSTIECFLAELMTHASGGSPVTAKDVQDIFERVPSIVVLDGLDEVGRPRTREKIVDAIEQFCRRGKAYSTAPKIIVTTRPSTNALPEPSIDQFDLLILNPLDVKQRDEYLRKWCGVRGIRGSEGRALRKNFKVKSAEPYIGDLAGNPMQLTILLDLLHKHGEATPTQRTELYDSYVDLLLAREANKHPESVSKHQKQLREIIPFLGWYLQSQSEADSLSARMSIADLKAAIRHFLYTYGKPQSVVDELFEATSDRLWALTSKQQGTFEFEVLSLREYFAARFLYRYAGEDIRRFDRNTVFRELLRRPYWLNTARFYGGNAEGGDVYVLADGIRDEISENNNPPSVVAAWTLLTDGVFASRPRQARDVLNTLCTDRNIEVLLEALRKKEIISLPEIPQLPPTDGGDPTWTRLTEQLATDPSAPETPCRVQTLRELLDQRAEFTRWWAKHMRAAINTPHEDAWLEMAARCEGAAGAAIDLRDIDLSRPLTAQFVLDTGLVPPPGSKFEADLVQAVLDGLCPNVSSVRSLPAQIAVAFGTEGFFTASSTGFAESSAGARRRRQEAITSLRKAGSPFAAAAALRRFKAGEKGSTFPWSNTAAALFEQAGPCWLASHIAIIGAASPHKLGVTRGPTMTPFGRDSHPSVLLAETRAHASDQQWWLDQLQRLNNEGDVATETTVNGNLAHAEWALALWCVASAAVTTALFTEWQSVYTQLPEVRRLGVTDVALRMSGHGWLKPLTGATDPATDVIRILTKAREPQTPSTSPSTYTRKPQHPASPPLLSVARAQNWLKVDTVGAYR